MPQTWSDMSDIAFMRIMPSVCEPLCLRESLRTTLTAPASTMLTFLAIR